MATETAQSHVDQRLEGRVSDFMSHKRQIHEDYYVMTQKTDDITKVSKLLENFSSVNEKTDSGVNKICRESEASLKCPTGVLPNGEYVLNRNNHCKRKIVDGNINYDCNKTFQNRQKRQKEVSSDEEYLPEANELSVTQAEINFIMG